MRARAIDWAGARTTEGGARKASFQSLIPNPSKDQGLGIEFGKSWILTACKPGFVECCHSDGHSSGSAVARTLEQPTRSVLIGVGHPSLPIWPCSRWGLPSHDCYQPRGGLLPRRFTLACAPASRRHRRSAFCCTVRRCLAAPPRRYLAARPLEPGLSSSTCVPATVRPPVSDWKILTNAADAMTGS